MTWFQLLSWGFCCGTLFFLFTAIYWQRFLLLKPSVLFVLFFNVQIQWGSALRSEWIEWHLPQPWDYFCLAQLFPFIVLFLSVFLFRSTAETTYRRITETSTQDVGRHITFFVIILASCSVLVTVWYLATISWSETGLYAALYNPKTYFLKREMSMKLLSSQSLKYGFSIFSTVIAPLFATLLIIKIARAYQVLNVVALIGWSVCIVLLIFAVSLYGARGPGAMLILSIFYALYLRAKFPFNPFKISIAVFIILAVPSVLVMFYNQQSLTLESFFDAYLNMIDRIVGRNIDSGVWTVAYVQKYEFFGVGGIPKLAGFFGKPPLDIFNIVGKAYRPDHETISANSSFIFAYYSCFGMGVFLPCLLLACLTDYVLVIYSKFPKGLVLACLAATAIAVAKFTYSFYTTVLISGGFAILPFFGFGLILFRHIIKTASSPSLQK